jgi:hypothetical protein
MAINSARYVMSMIANEQCSYILEQGIEPALGQFHKALLPIQVIAVSL